MSSPSDPEPPKDLRSRRREATRQEILQAAQEVLTTEGFAEGRMETIAARAGVSVGTLYNYFQDRTELIQTLWAQHHEQLVQAVTTAVDGAASRPVLEQLQSLVSTILGQLERRRGFLWAAMESTHGPGNEISKAKHLTHDVMMAMYLAAERVCKRGLEEGVLGSDHPDLLPAMLLGVIRGVMVHHFVTKTSLSPDEGPAVITFFLHGALAPKQGVK